MLSAMNSRLNSYQDFSSSRKSRVKSRMSTLSIGGGGGNVAWRLSGTGGFKMPKFQNSYRLEPHMPFRSSVSDRILAKVMTENLSDIRYDPTLCIDLCRNMAADVRDRLYKTDFDRVKYIVSMTIVENTGQSLIMQTGRLWDSDRDTYSYFVFESTTFIAAGVVTVLYYE